MENLPERETKTDQLPIIPRELGVDVKAGNGDLEADATPKRISHAYTPMKAMKVEYWHQGEQATERKLETNSKKKNHAKRADQLGMLLLGCALLLLVLVSVSLYLNNKRYLYSTGKVVPTSTAVVDFYQGNHAFSEKVAEEKAAKQSINGHEVHGISTVNDDLEVPLSEQMNSMSEKMKEMRSLQQADEAPPPSQDTGQKAELPVLKPTHDLNFKSPMEFNKDLPKSLQTNQ